MMATGLSLYVVDIPYGVHCLTVGESKGAQPFDPLLHGGMG